MDRRPYPPLGHANPALSVPSPSPRSSRAAREPRAAAVRRCADAADAGVADGRALTQPPVAASAAAPREASAAISNCSGTHEVHTRVLLQPDSLPALEDALATAHRERRKLRPLGSGLSPNGLGGMVNLALMDKVLDVDVKKKTVTVQAGIRVAELVDALREHDLTLQNFVSVRE